MPFFSVVVHPISHFLRWHESGELVLQPKFQRRDAWDDKAKSYLIDTIVRGLPMPMVFLRRTKQIGTAKRTYEVVDGQQRLNSITGFVDGRVILSARHNHELGGVSFGKLPDSVQRAFMEYEISTQMIEDATDEEVWALFERLNTYTLTLNRQEKLNARFFGEFKQLAYSLAASQSSIETWRSLGVFSDRQISRMYEVELTSDVLVALIRGISDITEIGRIYRDFDEFLPEEGEVSQKFDSILGFVVERLADDVRSTRFRRKTWFYSLLVAIADAMFGIPTGLGPTGLQSDPVISRRMRHLDEMWNEEEPPLGMQNFKNAVSRGTSHQRERRQRHSFLFKLIASGDDGWDRTFTLGDDRL